MKNANLQTSSFHARVEKHRLGVRRVKAGLELIWDAWYHIFNCRWNSRGKITSTSPALIRTAQFIRITEANVYGMYANKNAIHSIRRHRNAKWNSDNINRQHILRPIMSSDSFSAASNAESPVPHTHTPVAGTRRGLRKRKNNSMYMCKKHSCEWLVGNLLLCNICAEKCEFYYDMKSESEPFMRLSANSLIWLIAGCVCFPSNLQAAEMYTCV